MQYACFWEWIVQNIYHRPLVTFKLKPKIRCVVHGWLLRLIRTDLLLLSVSSVSKKEHWIHYDVHGRLLRFISTGLSQSPVSSLFKMGPEIHCDVNVWLLWLIRTFLSLSPVSSSSKMEPEIHCDVHRWIRGGLFHTIHLCPWVLYQRRSQKYIVMATTEFWDRLYTHDILVGHLYKYDIHKMKCD